ncbi:DUF159 family protein [Acetobacter aceti NBRC 14818]|nr:DUF159 family protein [Acetobacter aceti NBRC 14818]GAN57759.1 hypothetical protein Abac_018_172 [Acetobacter aceti NBRC 14818]GBQ46732.1 hypothetical protein AA0498_0361 [Acidomonas methanolica]CDG39791.1 Mll7390 protein [Asaia bogorensis]
MIARVMIDHIGNLQPLPEVWPNTMAPIIRNAEGGRELVMARWGMPTPPGMLKGRKVDRGITNIRHMESSWWRRWEGVEHRCLVPLTAFAEPEHLPEGGSRQVWFARADGEPLAFFAGLWCRWTSVRKLADGETTNNLYGFLTTEANREVGAIHPWAMPVILTQQEDMDLWMTAPAPEALQVQQALPDGALIAIAPPTGVA